MQYIDVQREQHQFSYQRLKFIQYIFFAVFIILFLRIFFVCCFQHQFWLKKQQSRFSQAVIVPPLRGSILDRNGFVLAKTVPAYTVGMTQQTKMLPALVQKQLAELLDIPLKQLKDKLNENKGYIVLKKKIELNLEQKKRLGSIKGIECEFDPKRIYPLGTATGQLLGFVNSEHIGVEGLEASLNSQLTSHAQHIKMMFDPKHHWRSVAQSIEWNPAPPVQLSIDARLQALLYEEMEQQYKKVNVHSLSGMILDPKTFEILAVLSYPSFDPQERGSYDEAYRLRPFLDLFEPGSLMKPVTVAAILESKPQASGAIYQTSPGKMTLDGETIQDIADHGKMGVAEILMHSSNVGLTKLLLEHGKGTLLPFLQQASFHLPTQAQLPYQVVGSIPKIVRPGSFVEATLAFGYGMQLNMAQLVQIYGVFAHDGMMYPLTLLKRDQLPAGRQVLSVQTNQLIQDYLENVVTYGTAKASACPPWLIGGKTGTVRRVGKHGYEKRYDSFFAALVPAHKTDYVILVHADDPKGAIYGGQVCAPIVKRLVPKLYSIRPVTPNYQS